MVTSVAACQPSRVGRILPQVQRRGDSRAPGLIDSWRQVVRLEKDERTEDDASI